MGLDVFCDVENLGAAWSPKSRDIFNGNQSKWTRVSKAPKWQHNIKKARSTAENSHVDSRLSAPKWCQVKVLVPKSHGNEPTDGFVLWANLKSNTMILHKH